MDRRKIASSTQDRGVAKRSSALLSKRIAVAICGGIAATEMVKIIRELRRHGAEVTAFMSSDAQRFITPLSIEWACAKPVVLEPSAGVDHLGPFDLLLVAPLTLNTLSKAALGIADNVVSLLIASSLGARIPLVCAPTMNAQLSAHPLYSVYRKQLEKWGARFLDIPPEESRLKMPAPEQVVEAVITQMKAHG